MNCNEDDAVILNLRVYAANHTRTRHRQHGVRVVRVGKALIKIINAHNDPECRNSLFAEEIENL